MTRPTTKRVTARTTTAKTTTTPTAGKTTARKRTTKTTTGSRRLPHHLRITGEVVIARPPRTGAVAHKPLDCSYTESVAGRRMFARFHLLVTTACRPPADGDKPQPYAQLSAGWADHTYRAVACPDCFPEATP